MAFHTLQTAWPFFVTYFPFWVTASCSALPKAFPVSHFILSFNPYGFPHSELSLLYFFGQNVLLLKTYSL